MDATYNNYVGSRSGYQSVYDYSKKLCARALELVNSSSTAAKYTIAVDVTNALTTSKLAVTITPYRAYGQYKIVIKNLPSGTLLTTGQNTRIVNSDGTLATAKNKSVSGNITIRGLGGASGEAVGKFTLSSIPKGSSDRSISVTATSFAKLAPTNEVEWGKSPDSSHQDMFIAGLAEGTTVTATKSATIPKLPVGSITVMKKDAGTSANITGCVFGLRKYDGSSYVDTGKTATTGSDGKATFSSLSTDTTSTGYYQVYEKTAPAGYEADSKFYCSFRVGTGWYSYVSTLAGNQSGTLADGGTVNATVSDANKTILSVSKSGDNYSATVYMYDMPKPPDTFSITMNKRDLSTGNALTGATYQLYVVNASGTWTQFKSGTVNTSGTVTFTGLKLADSSNGKFRVIESAMSNNAYSRDANFEVIISPSTGAWSYKGSFISNQSGTFTSVTTVKGTISLPGGGTASRNIISTAKDDSLYDFTIWQDDQRSAEHHLTVKKVVNVAGSQWPVSGMTFTLMRQNGSSWASVGTLTETAANSGIYQAPETSTGWTFSMVEGGIYKVVETTSAAGVVNSGWESPTFVWSEGTDLNLSYTVQNSIPTGHIGIIKVDSETNAPISGVGFKITAAENIVTTIGRNSTTWYSNGQVVMEGVTDSNGKLVAQNLPYGKYTVTETNHPSNYAYANVSFTVTDEREQLVRRVTTPFQFFGWDNLPDTPGDYYVKKDAIAGMIGTDTGINQLLTGMMRNLSGMAEDNPQRERMMGIYGDLTAFRNGTFSLFTPSAALQAEAEKRGVSLFVHPGRSLSKEQMVYQLHEGQTVFVCGTRYEIGELYSDNVVLRDSDFPLSTFLYVMEDLKPLLRADSRNDYLLVEPEQPEDVTEAPELTEEAPQEAPEQADVAEGTDEPAETNEPEETDEPPELTEAKALITAYTLAEFGVEPDFSDLSRVNLAFSTFEDGDHAAQVTANLPDTCIVYEVDGAPVHTLQCDSLTELNEYLANLDFAALISDAETAYAMEQGAEIPDEPELTETVEAEPESVEPEPVEAAKPEPSVPQEPAEQSKPALRELSGVGQAV